MSSFHSSFLILSVILTILTFNYCQAEDDQPRMQRLFNAASKEDFAKCLDESGLTKDDLKEFRENPPKEPNPKHMCFVKCIATSAGIIDKNGMIVGDLIKKHIGTSMDEATVNTVIKCMEAVGKISTCEDMAKAKKCMPKRPE